MRLKDDLFNKGVKGQKLEKRHPKLLYIKTIFHIHLNKQPHYGRNNGQIIFVERFSFKTVEFTGTILSTSKLNGCVS